jgi:DNA-binding response OmpR family regulator
LGEYDGLDLLQDIRKTYYDLPVILCSAYPVYKYDLKSIAADYYVVKNSTLEELKLKIKMALEGGNPFIAGTAFGDATKTEPLLASAV